MEKEKNRNRREDKLGKETNGKAAAKAEKATALQWFKLSE